VVVFSVVELVVVVKTKLVVAIKSTELVDVMVEVDLLELKVPVLLEVRQVALRNIFIIEKIKTSKFNFKQYLFTC
jgi:hypothetical protein